MEKQSYRFTLSTEEKMFQIQTSHLKLATSFRNQIHYKGKCNINKTLEKQSRDYDLRHLKSDDIKGGDNDRKGGKFTFKQLGDILRWKT